METVKQPEIRKVMVLSVSAGAGHVRAAEAIIETAKLNYPGLKIVHHDVMDLVPKLFKKLYADSYIKIVDRHPALWGFMYEKMDRRESDDSKLKKVRTAIERLNTRKLSKEIENISPDAIICTHFLPAELISRMIRKGKTRIPCWVQVTDFDIHGLWIHTNMAGYFAATEEVAWRIRDRGIPAEQIHVSGIPIAPVFKQKYSREECAAEIGVNPKKTTLLMMSGGLGVGGTHELAERLLELKMNCQVIALAGKNKKLLKTLDKLAEKFPGKLFPMGFTRTIERVMAASDLAISKPGGLTTSECLAMGLPMVVISPIPGQEERNADYLLENGAALKAHDAAGLEFRVKRLLENPKQLDLMRRNARDIGRPEAAEKVLKTVIETGAG